MLSDSASQAAAASSNIPTVIHPPTDSPSALSDPTRRSEAPSATRDNDEQDPTATTAAPAAAQPQDNLPVSPQVQSHFPSPSTVLADGYDSDVDANHRAAIDEEGPQEISEEELGEVGDDENENVDNQTAANEDSPVFVDIPESSLTKMRVGEIKAELSKRGLPTRGLKAELLGRLRQAIQDRVPCISERARNLQQENEVVSGFAPTARWRPLVPMEQAVAEPENAVRTLRAPTVPAEDSNFMPQKHNFAESFEREAFVGKEKIPRCHRNGHQMRDETTKEFLWTESVNISGGPRAEFLKEHGLDHTSSPAEWFKAFLPIYDSSQRHPGASSTPFWTHRWASYLNVKATMMGASVGGGLYPEFKPFTFEDVERHLGLYILQGLNPSPQIEQKFSSQAVDPVQGNDLCFRVFGPGAIRRHKHFKAFFCLQDPLKSAPPRKERPTYKVDPLLRHVQSVSMKSWRLGRDISGDEQTIGFQGRHADKLRITYKAEGDGFQCDALCDSGFTWTFWFRNQPAPQKYIQQGYSPLHSRILGMFDQLEDRNHNCWFDNLYLSAKFCKAAYIHAKSVRISGPTRKSGRGLPKCVIQEEVSNPADHRRVRGTVKAAVLQGDDQVPGLVAVSYYDQKPVHFLSTICEKIEWVECTKKVYSVETEQVENLRFLRLNINHDYNHDMGNVDIADQLRNYYRFDHWMRKRKWWWSLFFWAFGVLLVNCYLCYKHYMIKVGLCPMSQYDFRRAIALAWLDWKTYWPDRMAKGAKNKKRKITSDNNDGNRNGGGGQQQARRRSGDGSRRRDDATATATTTTSTTTSSRAPPVNNDSLCPRMGALRCRLDVCRGKHLPFVATSKEAKCALHHWAKQNRTRANILKCKTCRVHLCITCFRVFHTVEEIADIRKSFDERGERKNEDDSVETVEEV